MEEPLIDEYIQAWVDHFLALGMKDSEEALQRMESAYKALEKKYGRDKTREIDRYVNMRAHEIAARKLPSDK